VVDGIDVDARAIPEQSASAARARGVDRQNADRLSGAPRGGGERGHE
jgi:hypothetical protein